jgi:hypothetical protein
MNKLKYYMWGGIVFVLIVGTLAHFVYEWSGENFIVGLFVPVNESTWEHMKLVFFPMIIYTVFMENRLSGEYPCILPAHFVGNLLGTWLVALLFYSYSGILGFNVFILDLAVFVASVLIAFWTSYKLTLSNICFQKPLLQILILVLVIFMAICFIIYSYNPLSIGLFREP